MRYIILEIKKTRLIALTKIDSVSDIEKLEKLKLFLESKKENVFQISSFTKVGIKKLIDSIELLVKSEEILEKNQSVKEKNFAQPKNSIWSE